MNQELILTPTGSLRLRESENDSGMPSDTWMKRVAAAFLSSPAAGLFSMAATRTETPLSAVFSFWRDFACSFLTQLCRTPASAGSRIDPVEPPGESELGILVLSAPPMQGGEYLCPEVFLKLWNELNVWTREQIAGSSDGLAGWLKENAPMWRQVGRVCFHLAENKRDPEFPFAFLATYAPSLSRAGQVQYRPLGKALQEYAGERNKNALINLLSPVQLASEKVDFVRDLVDSGDIYHPLAWTPAEAYRLLKNVHQLEESGLLVRLPDWWKKRPRPRVAVSIGDKVQSLFGADAMLDFKVGLALGDAPLTEEEWRDIMASEEGLAYVRGQWVEVDRARLSEALSHWKQVEDAAANGGISFIEGMRLLAGAPADLDVDKYPGTGEREWSFVNSGKWLSEVLSGLRNPEGLALKRSNAAFQGILRHYQEVGRD